MNFKKLVKAEEFDAQKEQVKFKAVHHIFGQLEKLAKVYVDLGFSKDEIMEVMNEALLRFEEDVDMWNDWGL